MAQVSSWGYAIADKLFEFLDFGKPTFFRSGPNSLIVDPNLEYASGTGHERKLADLCRESR